MKAGLVFLTSLLLLGCASTGGGFLTGGQIPDSYVKSYCFDGQANAGANAPFAGADAIGKIQVAGVVIFGDVPDEAVVLVAAGGCEGKKGGKVETE